MDKQTLLAFQSKPLRVEIEGLPEAVYVRQWSVKQREEFTRLTSHANSESKLSEVYPYVLRWSLCDALGKPLLTDDDLAATLDLPAPVVDDLVKQALKYNGLTKDKEDEAEKNSVTAGSSGSLPDTSKSQSQKS